MKNKIKEYFLICVGSFLVAISIKLFLEPNKIAGGGIAGIAIIINQVFPKLTIQLLMLVMNIILFIVAFIVIGNKFGAKTIFCSLFLAICVGIIAKIFPKGAAITDDLFLATVFGTLISGVGMGIIFNQNASSGGTDIIAKIITKTVHMDIGKALLMVDCVITIASIFVFGVNSGMYSLLSVIINGLVVDNVIEGMTVSKTVYIISSKHNEIKGFIIGELERGCTIFTAEGAYTHEEKKVLYTVLDRKEFVELRKFIHETDPKAFITVNTSHEVFGEGFKHVLGDE